MAIKAHFVSRSLNLYSSSCLGSHVQGLVVMFKAQPGPLLWPAPVNSAATGIKPGPPNRDIV